MKNNNVEALTKERKGCNGMHLIIRCIFELRNFTIISISCCFVTDLLPSILGLVYYLLKISDLIVGVKFKHIKFHFTSEF